MVGQWNQLQCATFAIQMQLRVLIDSSFESWKKTHFMPAYKEGRSHSLSLSLSLYPPLSTTHFTLLLLFLLLLQLRLIKQTNRTDISMRPTIKYGSTLKQITPRQKSTEYNNIHILFFFYFFWLAGSVSRSLLRIAVIDRLIPA